VPEEGSRKSEGTEIEWVTSACGYAGDFNLLDESINAIKTQFY
jgi:hypothetical protein